MSDLTPKQAKFVKDYLETGNATEAAALNYDVKNRNTAKSIGSENLSKPDIQDKLSEALDIAKSTIISLATGAENENVRLRAAQDIVDRTEGKATQRIEADHTSKGQPITGINYIVPNGDNTETDN